MKRTRLRLVGHSTTSELKREIQSLVRENVILRDGGCILRDLRYCDDPVLQADHLITRANSATYADTRLIVCVCRSCHLWKKWNKEQYDSIVHRLIGKERSDLWDRCQKDSWKPSPKSSYDWKIAILALKQELRKRKSG